MRVFSRANVLLTFMSHASLRSGSHTFTILTLACGTQTTLSIPSVDVSRKELYEKVGVLTLVKHCSEHMHFFQLLHRRLYTDVNCGILSVAALV